MKKATKELKNSRIVRSMNEKPSGQVINIKEFKTKKEERK